MYLFVVGTADGCSDELGLAPQLRVVRLWLGRCGQIISLLAEAHINMITSSSSNQIKLLRLTSPGFTEVRMNAVMRESTRFTGNE